MGTSNFHNVNSSKIYAVCMNSFDEETQETVYPEQYEYDEMKENVKDCILEMCKENKDISFDLFPYRDRSELRSFPSSVLCSISKSKTIGGLECEVVLTSIIRSGYYEGANLDFQINSLICGYDCEDLYSEDECIEHYDYYSDYKGISKTHAKQAYKWLEKTKNELSEKLEGVYQNISEPLVVVAQFSNGETIYQKS